METRGLPLAALVLAAGPALGQDAIAVPSGQEVSFVDVIRDAPGPGGTALRFRFLAPTIARAGGFVDPETTLADMQALCEGFALPRVSETGPRPAQIVISLMDRPVPFGTAAPDATQFFEVFRPEGGACIWEPF